MFRASRLSTTTFLRNPLFLLVVLLDRRWLAKALERLTLPVPVVLNLFAAPRFVFNFILLPLIFLKSALSVKKARSKKAAGVKHQ
jgi:hypothetical protein